MRVASLYVYPHGHEIPGAKSWAEIASILCENRVRIVAAGGPNGLRPLVTELSKLITTHIIQIGPTSTYFLCVLGEVGKINGECYLHDRLEVADGKYTDWSSIPNIRFVQAKTSIENTTKGIISVNGTAANRSNEQREWRTNPFRGLSLNQEADKLASR